MKFSLSILLVFSFLSSFISFNAHALCITAETANLRSSKDTSSEENITWVVPKHMPLRPIRKEGEFWVVSDVDGDKHWVHESVVTKSYMCAVIKAKKANLRTGPGTNYKPVPFLNSVEQYATFIYVSQKDKWAQLKDDVGNIYWVYRPLIYVY